eukprot:scaffold133253_cov23-Tisochrysis_lutea.AAC.2
MQLSPQLLANSLHASMLSIAMCIHTGVLALTQPAALQHLAHQLRTCLQLVCYKPVYTSLAGIRAGALALTRGAALQHLSPQLLANSL